MSAATVCLHASVVTQTVAANRYAYQRFDFPHMIEALDAATGKDGGITEADMDDAERRAEQSVVVVQERTEAEIAAQDQKYPALPGGKFTEGGREAEAAVEEADMEAMLAELSEEDQAAFRDFQARDAANTVRAETSWGRRSFAHRITHPDSKNPTYMFATNTDYNESQLAEWTDAVAPRLRATRDRWARLAIASASDEALLEAMRDMCMEEGYYWSCNSSRTFGVRVQLICHARNNM